MSTQNIFGMTDTWNAAGNTFTAIGMNVTDTASAAGSRLLDLQVGAVSRLSIGKGGNLTITQSTANTSALAVTGYSVTGSNAQPFVDLAGTVNTSGNVTALKLNITNTAIGAGSSLIDLATSGNTTFRVGVSDLTAASDPQWVADFYARTNAAPTSTFGGGIRLFTKNLNGNARPAAIAAINDIGGSNLSSLAFYTHSSGGPFGITERVRIDSAGNMGVGTSSFGTNAARVISVASGTEPSSGPADTVQIYSVDLSAGNTIPAVYCEGSGVTNAGITSTAVTHKIALKVNGTVYYLLATTNGT